MGWRGWEGVRERARTKLGGEGRWRKVKEVERGEKVEGGRGDKERVRREVEIKRGREGGKMREEGGRRS